MARLDFQAPEVARVTELWLSCTHRSQATAPGGQYYFVEDAGQRVGKAGSRGRSGEVDGNAAAGAAVSIVRVRFSGVGPGGQGRHPALSDRKMAGAVTRTCEAAARGPRGLLQQVVFAEAWTVR